MDSGPRPFDQFALRLYGSMARRRMVTHPQLPTKLAQAAVPLVPVSYLATLYLRCTIAVAAGVVVAISYTLVTGGLQGADPRAIIAAFGSIGLFWLITYSYGMLWPDLKINARRKNIDENLPYALNFLAALAAAGVVPDEMFGALGKQSAYGQISREANLIYRDTQFFSSDLLQALHQASRRSPSQQLGEFFQGAVTTVQSGGDLKTFILAKAEHFALINQRKQRAFIESMGVMAESYVVVGAAAPLFLIVILSVMLLLSSGSDPTFMLNLVVLVAMPIIHGAFTYIMRNTRAE